MRKKIAFVVQRYGLEVNGGAELQCRQFAEHMAEHYDVEVLTTKAIDYVTWRNEYTVDEENINGVLVRRFSVKQERNNEKFNKLSETILQCRSSKKEEEEWMRQQGPYSEELINYLKEHKEDYCVFVFFTYLYYTTYFGLKEVADKSIIFTEAHDETPIYLNIFNDMFKLPKVFFYNTEEEKKFVENKFGVESVLNNNGMGGVGIEISDDISADRFRKKYSLDNFILYIGRIDEHKGCKVLFDYFKEYKKRNGGDLKLVLMGKAVIPLPETEDIVNLGFVSDEDKFDGLSAARMLVLPSQFESLSIVVLEAMAVGIPVLVNGNCAVLKNHCTKSNAGLYYKNYFEFEGCLNYLLNHADAVSEMTVNAKQYVNDNYQWDVIVRRLCDLIEKIIEN